MDPAEGRRLETAVRKQLATVLTGFDAFVLPTVGARAFAAGEDYVETDLVVNGVPLAHFADASLTPAFNICSSHPVLSVPSGRASNGVPTGVQIVTAPDAETTAFRIAAAVEQTAGTGFTAGWEPQLPLGGPANTDTAPR